MDINLSDESFKKKFTSGGLLIDCQEIRLRQNEVESPREWIGSGSLRVHPRDGIEARIISMVPISPIDQLMRMTEVRSGEIIPDKHYFSLTAIDVNGCIWTNPSVSVQEYSHQKNTVVVMHCDWIRSATKVENERDRVHLLFLDELDFPLNSLEYVKTRKGDKESVRFSYVSSKWLAGGADLEYRMTQGEANYCELQAKCCGETSFPDSFEIRLIEAVRFITAKSVSWAICETTHNGTKSIEISRTLPLNLGLFPPPLSNRRDLSKDFYKLLDAYLWYAISQSTNDNFSFISSKVNSLYKLKDSSSEAIALLISVAIESVIQEEFKHLGKASKTTLNDLKIIFDCLNKLSIDGVTLNRAKGSLGGMKSSRAADKLQELVKAGVIGLNEFDAWKGLRNSSAHGSLHIAPERRQELLDHIYEAALLLYKLIFLKIGYDGQYTDYSTHGWPPKMFNASAFTFLRADKTT